MEVILSIPGYFLLYRQDGAAEEEHDKGSRHSYADGIRIGDEALPITTLETIIGGHANGV